MAMFAHLSILLNLVTGFLGLVPALIIYFAYKDRSRYVAYQSLQAVIFQLVYFFGAVILAGIVAIVLDPAGSRLHRSFWAAAGTPAGIGADWRAHLWHRGCCGNLPRS